MGLMPESFSKESSDWVQCSQSLFEARSLPTMHSQPVKSVSDIPIRSFSSADKELRITQPLQDKSQLCKTVRLYSINSQLKELNLYETSIELNCPIVEVGGVFEANSLLPGIMVTKQGQLVGMISRRHFFECMSRFYSLELSSKQPLRAIYQIAQSEILVLPSHTPIAVAVEKSLQRSPELIYEPIVVQLTSGEYRLLDVHQLLLAQTQIHQLATDALRQSEVKLYQQATQLKQTLQELQQAQTQLMQSEKMSSVGQLVTGVAYAINNPINFIYGNLDHASQYTQDLLHLLHLYAQHYPQPAPEIQAEIEAIDLEFLKSDLPKLLSSMQVGADRIYEIIRSLRNFSSVEEGQLKRTNLHDGLDSTLKLLQNRLKAQTRRAEITVHKEYGDLPLVDCYSGELNQVFMNIFNNAIDAIEEAISEGILTADSSPHIRIQTQLLDSDCVAIRITDNGSGMTEEVRRQLFNPFFSTKPGEQFKGLGLSLSHQIVVEKHYGQLKCFSQLGQGSELVIELPIRQPHRVSVPSAYYYSGDRITAGVSPVVSEEAA